MPWDPIKLNDGNIMPSLVFGNGRTGNGQASIDTAQNYRNETEAGIGIRESGLARDKIFITIKLSGMKDIPTAIRDSLVNLGVAYVDMYTTHNPDVGAIPDLQTTWAQVEVVKREGLAKSIGVSNYNVEQLKTILASGTIAPALNQIELHPYVNAAEAPIIVFCKEHNIAVEGYSPLEPISWTPHSMPLLIGLRYLRAKCYSHGKGKGRSPCNRKLREIYIGGIHNAGGNAFNYS